MDLRILSYKIRSNIEQILFFWLIAALFFLNDFEKSVAQERSGDVRKTVRIAFYNCENFFDIEDDPLTHDDEFTPEGTRHWDNRKFYQKVNHTFKVILALGNPEPPALMGLCEIENRFVLKKLVYETPLKKFDYRIIHYESPDRRGIDVALLYRKGLFEPLYSRPVAVRFPFDTASRTRDILYVKGLLLQKDTIHIFVNHWPSRYGGYLPTVPKRKQAALMLRNMADSILRINPGAAVLIMGDFNDGPYDESFSLTLRAKDPAKADTLSELYNLMLHGQKDWPYGSLKYREGWNKFDQIVVSGNMLRRDAPLCVSENGGVIFHAPFLLEEDNIYLGQRLNRTYVGLKYHGGFSDHLPVFVDVVVNE